MAEKMLSVLRLRELLSYSPETGAFLWSARKRHSAMHVGDTAGSRQRGYLVIRIDRRGYFAHRVAWAMTHGVWPTQQIDHIDGDKLNNRISNLRDVSNKVNGENRKCAQLNNSTGLLGVTLHKGGKYQAAIKTDGRLRHLGLFVTCAAAHAAYLKAKRELHVGCTI